MSFIGKNPSFNTAGYTPQSADPTNPTEGDTFYSDGTSRAEGLYIYTNLNWVAVGSGAGALNFYAQGDAEQGTTSDFTTGNNATFDGGGTFNGTFSVSTTAADLINGSNVYKWVGNATAASNDDNYIASDAFDVPQGYRGQLLLVKGRYKWDGADGNMKLVIKDQTNNAILTLNTDTITQHDNADNTSAEVQVLFQVPSDAAQLKFGWQTITGEVSKTLLWDDFVVTPDLNFTTNLVDSQTIRLQDGNGYGSTNNKIPRFNTVVTNSGSNIATYADSATDGMSITINRKAKAYISYTELFAAAQTLGLSLNSTQLTTSINSITAADRLATEFATASNTDSTTCAALDVVPGDVIRCHTDGGAKGTNDARAQFTILLISETENIITPQNSADSYVKVRSSTSKSGNRFLYNTTDDDVGTAITYSPGAGTFTINESGVYHMSASDRLSAVGHITIAKSTSTVQTDSNVLAFDENGGGNNINISTTNYLNAGDVISVNSTGTSLAADYAKFAITRVGVANLSAIPFSGYQTKTLSSDVTTTTTMSDLTFNNLEIGKQYRVNLKTLISSVNPGETVQVLIKTGGTTHTTVGRFSSTATNDITHLSDSFIFEAEGTVLTFDSSMSTTGTILGNGTTAETVAQLEELPSHKPVTQWT